MCFVLLSKWKLFSLIFGFFGCHLTRSDLVDRPWEIVFLMFATVIPIIHEMMHREFITKKHFETLPYSVKIVFPFIVILFKSSDSWIPKSTSNNPLRTKPLAFINSFSSVANQDKSPNPKQFWKFNFVWFIANYKIYGSSLQGSLKLNWYLKESFMRCHNNNFTWKSGFAFIFSCGDFGDF